MQGFGHAFYKITQALKLLLRYSFGELNLYRVTAVVPAYNEGALKLFQKFGFVEEIRRRQAMNRDGQFWDLVSFGLLNAEWREKLKGDALSVSKGQG